ncbi:class I SAM-dependent methyltransferase [Chloroflexota bacterium]
MDIRKHNRAAWNRETEQGNKWTIPVSSETIAQARKGIWNIVLTPTKPVPEDWFPKLADSDVLCLASGGGQQGPILAAAGASVTVLDNSPLQLQSDATVSKRDSLNIRTVEGDMADLSAFPDSSFDLIFHPVSNNFSSDILVVWKEAYRVLRSGGVLLAGFVNPGIYLFDYKLEEQAGILQVKYQLPYSDAVDLDADELQKRIEKLEPLEFSHTLEEQIGGQLEAGFIITGLFEDRQDEETGELLARYMPTCIATRAVKP